MLDNPSLRALLQERDLILVTGKGGTGKSTLVAALAELAARLRGGACAVELSAHPRLPRMIAPGGAVEVVNVDAEEAIAPAVGRLLGVPPIIGAVLKNRVIRLFIRTSPAVREMISLDEVQDLVQRHSRKGFPVIVDLPATGHALSILETPRAVQRMLRVGPLAQVARRVEQLLLDRSRSELVIIALPEELPINETIELVRRSTQIGLASSTVIVNQVPAAGMQAADRPLLDLLAQDAESPVGRFATTAQGELEGVQQARAQIDRLRSAVSAQVIELPRYSLPDPRACAQAVVQALA